MPTLDATFCGIMSLKGRGKRKDPAMISTIILHKPSTAIDNISYDDVSRDCYVEFANGNVYEYHNVSHDVIDGIRHAIANGASIGRFVNANLVNGDNANDYDYVGSMNRMNDDKYFTIFPE
jgi:hypothetical protein